MPVIIIPLLSHALSCIANKLQAFAEVSDWMKSDEQGSSSNNSLPPRPDFYSLSNLTSIQMSSTTTLPDLSLASIPSNDVEIIKALMKSLNLTIPLSITAPKVSAAYHTIYILSTPPQAEYVLRICYPLLPSIKTENEVAILSWVRQNTKIPVPEVIAYSSSADNALGQEYVMLSKEEGETLSDMYTEFDEQEKVGVVDQLVDFLLGLY